MSETINDKTVYSLSEVTESIRKLISGRYTTAFWVKAEMIKLNHYVSSGHCYPDLVDKKDKKIIAQIRATLWSSDYLSINARFMQVLHEPLKDGIKILFSAKPVFHPVHGLSLQIIDIDPSYSLGELEMEKQNNIDQLKAAGIFEKNKSRKLPLLPKRLAIISVVSSKGYHDFNSKVDPNPWHYKIYHRLFPSLLQGDKAAVDLLTQLRNIKKLASHFDAVAIIRGGGGDIGLSCYNNYALCKEICEFPIPVLTGIGHSTNETIAEMVSFKNCITPTDLADFLIQQFHNFSFPLTKMQETISRKALQLLADEKSRLSNMARLSVSATRNALSRNKHQMEQVASAISKDSKIFFIRLLPKINILSQRLSTHLVLSFSNMNHEIINLEHRLQAMDPINVLKRGYTITKVNDRFVKSAKDVKENDIITTITADGEITSTVKTNKS